jgi:CO/xanthine dehydrogenase FAD-binding subunit
VRGDAARHELAPARTLDEALAHVAAGYRPLAGGTDIMVVFAAGMLDAPRLVDLWSVGELRGIEVTPGEIVFGPLTTYTDVQQHAVVRRELPMLVRAAAETGGWAIQNRGTLGGNIANASPAADSPPALLAYDAELELASAARGTRRVEYATFHTGYKKSLLAPDELIVRIRVPRRERQRQMYRKVGPRRAQAISKVCFAAVEDEAGVRIALGAVAPVPLRCAQTEILAAAGDRAGARAAFAQEISPIDDVRSTARYRRQVAANLLDAFLG